MEPWRPLGPFAAGLLLIAVGLVSGPGIGGVVGGIGWFIVGVAVVASFLSHRRQVRSLHRAQRRQDAESELHETEVHDLSGVLAIVDIGVVAIREGVVVYTNEAAERLLGPAATHGEAPLPLAVTRVLAAGDDPWPRSVELELAGSHVRADLDRADGQLVVIVLHDVTSERRTEQVRRDFVAAASHELKTPAAAIHAAAETVLDALEHDPDAARQFAERVHRTSSRLVQLVSDLLDLSRLDTTSHHAHDELAFDDIVERAVGRLGGAAASVDLSTESVRVFGSDPDLSLAVDNLLDNAVRHSNGPVEVRLRRDNGSAVLEVEDHGDGIPHEDLERIFERFYRVDPARSAATGGTGLGLSIVRHVVESHGGEVAAVSRVGEGSTFTVRLPSV